ncbi:glutamine amidotransferase type 2 domain protein [Vibrio phage 1.262.O._10N.286.51.A9]|nr:glutamine amidotransferase type 2 domain protein [Vibrio phage 1.262.O._10N.286.51.A9]
MCGLVAVLGEIGIHEERMFNQLLEVDSIRGRHSTGVIKVEIDGYIETKKKAVNGMDFVSLYGGWLKSGTKCALIGHNRHATAGAVNDVNAHPFEHGDIIGIHNGTLNKQSLLDDWKDFDVDSDNIFHHLNKNGIDDTASKLSGAYAIMYMNTKDMTFNMFRNKERPLYTAKFNKGKTVVITSERYILAAILERNGIEVDIQFVREFTTEKLVTFDPLKVKKNGVNEEAVYKDLTFYKAPKWDPKKNVGFGFTGGYYKDKEKAFKKGMVKADKKYPMIITTFVNKKGARSTEVGLQMLCHPYHNFDTTIFTDDKVNICVDSLDDNFGIVMAKIDYTSSSINKGLVVWGSQLNPIDENTAKTITHKGLKMHDLNRVGGIITELVNGNTNSNIDNVILLPSGKPACTTDTKPSSGSNYMDDADWDYGEDENGLPLSRADWVKTEASKFGCCVCGDRLSPELGEILTWTQNTNAMCSHCAEHNNDFD